MAYNSAFPMGYQYMQAPQQAFIPPQPMPQIQPQQQQAQGNSITWVQGEAGAKSYLVAPNTTVQLWDSEAQTIYLKSADASGMPTMKVLDYVIREQSGQNTPTLMQDTLPEYVTKEEFSTFSERVQRQLDRIGGNRNKGDRNNGKQTVSTDE